MVKLEQSSSACFFDGRRFVHFRNTDSIPKPSILDKTRSFIEQRFGARISWWPFPPVRYSCPSGLTRFEWKVGRREKCYALVLQVADVSIFHSGAHTTFMSIYLARWSSCTKKTAARYFLLSQRNLYCHCLTHNQAHSIPVRVSHLI